MQSCWLMGCREFYGNNGVYHLERRAVIWSQKGRKQLLSDAISTCLRSTRLRTLPDCFLVFSLNLVNLVLTQKPLCVPSLPFSFLSLLLSQSTFPEAGGLVWSPVPQPGAGDPPASRTGWTASESESTPLAQRRLPDPEHGWDATSDRGLLTLIQHDGQWHLGALYICVTPLNCCTITVGEETRKTALNPSHIRTG